MTAPPISRRERPRRRRCFQGPSLAPLACAVAWLLSAGCDDPLGLSEAVFACADSGQCTDGFFCHPATRVCTPEGDCADPTCATGCITRLTPGAEPTIQGAIDQYQSGSCVILLGPGEYRQAGVLVGRGTGQTTLTGELGTAPASLRMDQDHDHGVRITDDRTTLSNLVIDGGAAFDAIAGKAGMSRAGVVVDGASDVLIEGVEIHDIHGHKGVFNNDSNSEYAGPGGLTAGIQLIGAVACQLRENTIRDLAGGEGGGSDPGQSAGTGGWAIGVHLADAVSCAVVDNQVQSIIGGPGGMVDRGTGGTGGVAAGIYVGRDASAIEVVGNTVSDIRGGTGGAGGTGGTSGVEQEGFAVYLDDIDTDMDMGTGNTVDGDPIIFLHGPDDDGARIAGLTLDGPTNQTNWGRIVVVDAQDVVIDGVRVARSRGRAGRSARIANVVSGTPREMGTPGYCATGVYLRRCDGCSVSASEVAMLDGGSGGAGYEHPLTFNYDLAAGPGGPAIGILIERSRDVTIDPQVSVNDLTGGHEGPWREQMTTPTGDAVGIWVTDDSNLREPVPGARQCGSLAGGPNTECVLVQAPPPACTPGPAP